MRTDGYILPMLKPLSARGSLFLFVRTHHRLEYYFNLSDTRRSANQNGVLSSSSLPRLAKVVEIHPILKSMHSRRQ